MQDFKLFLEKINTNQHLKSLFNEIRISGPIYKSKLGLTLPISKPTRYELINSLIQSGMVAEAPSTGRRNPMIDVIKGRYYSFGIDIHMDGTRIVLMDLKSNIECELFLPNKMNEKRTKSVDNKEDVLTRLLSGIADIIQENNLTPANVISCGISDAGMIDRKDGISINYPGIPNWTDVPIRSIINRLIQVPVFLFRDSNTMAISEMRALDLVDIHDMLCISLRRGIAFGTFINGQLYSGETGNAGLWGFTHYSDKADKSDENKNLDSLLGFESFATSFRKIIELKMNSEPSNTFYDDDAVLKYLFDAYEKKNKEVFAKMEKYINNLAYYMANLDYIFDIGHFILTGRFVLCGDTFILRLTECLKETLPSFRHKNIKISKGRLGLKAASSGAAYRAQDMLFR
jgi:predicted NBD/HSP70 family sugar kinase